MDNEEKSKSSQIPQTLISTKTSRTATNVLYFALKTLGSISNNVPVAGALSGVIEPLLDITSHIEQSSLNAQGLIQLATRIERLTLIVEEMAKSNPNREHSRVVLALQQELASMATDLKAASQRGELNQFFNNIDNASALGKHNMILTQIIADSGILVGVHEVLKSLRELAMQISKSQKPLSSTVMDDTIGRVGATRGPEHVGSEGAEGTGPRLELDPCSQIDKVSGGTGGTGGVDVKVGGKGGTGKGPVISFK
ncbi:hypothetical protein K438DRAFT_1939849 [Mycena galopus ATCC 62051]|nr:hypothetical protein K438DRAFT_1939849 [Mycena galopus ATCC 62051]